jgi:hypothetical protein
VPNYTEVLYEFLVPSRSLSFRLLVITLTIEKDRGFFKSNRTLDKTSQLVIATVGHDLRLRLAPLKILWYDSANPNAVTFERY